VLKDLLRYRANAVYVGGILLTAFLIFLAVAYMINRSFTLNFWDPGYQLKADFVDADGIANASDIRIAGVYVGQVTEIRSVSGGLAEITFRVDKEHAPMHQGTRANLRLQTLLGQKFIELDPGPNSASQLEANSVIPSNKTTSPVDFDQFLSSFNKPTRDALSNLITELGTATDGRGQDINALLVDLNQLSVQSAPDLQTFADRSDHINNILINAADVTQNLSDNREHLANVFTNLNTVLGAVAANDPGFRRFIHEGNLSLGHGLTQLAGEQKNLNDTIRLLRPALAKANPTLEDATALSRQFQSFISIADVFTSNLLSGVSAYNQNSDPGTPETNVCNTEGQSVGCGGPYLKQPTVLVQDPSASVDCENSAPSPATGCPAGSAAGTGAQRSLLNFLLGR
jgi:phospholipid/cholesterol/gamma-HCH transport system substrate-binding protein